MLYTGQSEINNGTQVTTYDTFPHTIQNTTLGPDTVLCIAVYVEGLTVLWLAWHTNNHSGMEHQHTLFCMTILTISMLSYLER